ncbi:MAG: hypothetical protein FJ349_05170 [Sphingomonadales bacterium]|nr:hypothetical protein [Sphingomonadales bacterium]
MKITQAKILTALTLGFGLLSLFSVWNIYNWDFLGWGSKLFLFPFLTVIALMAKLSPKKPKWISSIQIGLMALHGVCYFVVFNLQDPHQPNLLLLLVPMLLSTICLIAAKSQQKQSIVFLAIAAILFILLGTTAKPVFFYSGICFELFGLLLYLIAIMRSSKSI